MKKEKEKGKMSIEELREINPELARQVRIFSENFNEKLNFKLIILE